MQEILQKYVTTPSLMRSSSLPFGEFLASLFQSLGTEGVHYCVLRNYKGFPDRNDGHDVDFLIGSSELPLAMRALRSIQGTRIVGYSERSAGAIVFLEGVSATPGVRSLQIDLFLGLSWKKLPYLPVETMLQAVIPWSAGGLNFFVPSPVYEAISSLLATLLIGGRVNEKYFPQVQRTIAGNRSQVTAILSRQFGRKIATRLVDSVMYGDRPKMLGCVLPLRASLVLRSLLHRPFRGPLAIAQHYAREFTVRFSPRSLETVCILGPDQRGNTAIIENLLSVLQSAAKIVEKRPLRQRLAFGGALRSKATNVDSPAICSRGAFVSMVNAILWLVDEWLSQFAEKKCITLRIYGRSYHELLIDPQKYCYGGPMWFARLVGKLFPSFDLWIFLDPTVEGLQSRKSGALPAETLRQLEAYRAFVKTRGNYVILDTSKPVAIVTEEAYAAIINMLFRRTGGQIKDRSNALQSRSHAND